MCRYSSYCEGEGKPWFFKDLSKCVTSDIEEECVADNGRSGEDVLLELISLFVL